MLAPAGKYRCTMCVLPATPSLRLRTKIHSPTKFSFAQTHSRVVVSRRIQGGPPAAVLPAQASGFRPFAPGIFGFRNLASVDVFDTTGEENSLLASAWSI